MKGKTPTRILMLDNVRSAHNVGSLFRIADTVGIQKLILAGVTPTPIDRFGRPVKEIAKTALGAEQTLLWEHVSDGVPLLETFKQVGYHIYVLEQDQASIDYKTVTLHEPFVFIVGNEVDGVDKNILKLTDTVLAIPMRGKKESLNVAVATAVALFRILNV